jgi:hypothetical protein
VPFEAIVIALIVVANGVLGFVQERKAEQAVAALQRMAAPAATVVRDGAQARVPAEELVPGDLMVLAEGEPVSRTARPCPRRRRWATGPTWCSAGRPSPGAGTGRW